MIDLTTAGLNYRWAECCFKCKHCTRDYYDGECKLLHRSIDFAKICDMFEPMNPEDEVYT